MPPRDANPVDPAAYRHGAAIEPAARTFAQEVL